MKLGYIKTKPQLVVNQVIYFLIFNKELTTYHSQLPVGQSVATGSTNSRTTVCKIKVFNLSKYQPNEANNA